MKILVTGGLGFIGSHTVVELQNEGYDVVVIDNLANSSTEVLDGIEAISGKRPAFEELDLRDKSKLEDFFKQHSDLNGVIHFAASKAVGESVQEHNTVENLGKLFAAAKQNNMTVAVSPHYYYPTDKGWKFEGALEKLMHKIGMFDRNSPYTMEGFDNSGADFMPEYKDHILDGKTIVTSPHKVYGPEANDLVLQLRKNRVDQVVLAGMSANLCVEAHLRELLEQGFEVAVVKDATAAAKIPEGDGYHAAIINFRYIANAVWTTEEAIQHMAG